MYLDSLFQNEPRLLVPAVLSIFLFAYGIRSVALKLLEWLLGSSLDFPTVPKPSGTDFREVMKKGIREVSTVANWVRYFS